MKRSAIDKLCALSDLVDTLEAQYKKDHDDLVEAYNNQEIPTCVKVETDTVYFNMNQILKKVKYLMNKLVKTVKKQVFTKFLKSLDGVL